MQPAACRPASLLAPLCSPTQSYTPAHRAADTAQCIVYRPMHSADYSIVGRSHSGARSSPSDCPLHCAVTATHTVVTVVSSSDSSGPLTAALRWAACRARPSRMRSASRTDRRRQSATSLRRAATSRDSRWPSCLVARNNNDHSGQQPTTTAAHYCSQRRRPVPR